MFRYFILVICLTYTSTQAQSLPPLTPAQKVYGLSRFWQEVNYNFVYLNKVDRHAWDSAYIAMIDIVQKTTNDYEYFRELQRFCALLKDSHTNIYPPNHPPVFNTMFGDYRLFIKNVGGKAIITHINSSKKNVLPPGTEILEVNGLPTTEYLKKYVSSYISSSTDYVLEDWSINNLLKGLENESYLIKVRRPQKKDTSLTIIHSRSTETDTYPPLVSRRLLDFRWLDSNIGYLALNSFSDPTIDSLFKVCLPELYKAKGLIIDLRSNGGGNSNIAIAILEHLTPERVLYGSRSSSRLHIPAHKAWGAFVQPKDTINSEWNRQSYLTNHDAYYHMFRASKHKVKLKSKRILVPIVLLIGHETASAAEDFLIYADQQTHMTKIGEPTFGSTGQPYSFTLPGGGSARVCTKKDTYPDGREFVGYGIQPDIFVQPTVSDFLKNKDSALEKGIAFLQQKIRP
jgi:C-terminal processing protease CtpA/Prc